MASGQAVNAVPSGASYAPNIARGWIFVVFGGGFGSATLVGAPSLPSGPRAGQLPGVQAPQHVIGPDRKLRAVEVKAAGATLEAGQPRELFPTSAANLPYYIDLYDVTADGQRFLINSALEEAASSPITMVENWAAGSDCDTLKA